MALSSPTFTNVPVCSRAGSDRSYQTRRFTRRNETQIIHYRVSWTNALNYLRLVGFDFTRCVRFHTVFPNVACLRAYSNNFSLISRGFPFFSRRLAFVSWWSLPNTSSVKETRRSPGERRGTILFDRSEALQVHRFLLSTNACVRRPRPPCRQRTHYQSLAIAAVRNIAGCAAIAPRSPVEASHGIDSTLVRTFSISEAVKARNV